MQIAICAQIINAKNQDHQQLYAETQRQQTVSFTYHNTKTSNSHDYSFSLIHEDGRYTEKLRLN